MTDRPRRVLVVATVSRTVQAFLLRQLDAMLGRGWAVMVAASGDLPAATGGRPVECVEISFSRRPSDVAHHARSLRALLGVLRRWRPDVIYTHTPIASALVRVAVAVMPARDRPAVAYFAHGFHFLSSRERSISARLWYWAERVLSRWTNLLFVLNRDDEASVSSWKIAIRGNVRYIPGIGIDPDEFDPRNVRVPRKDRQLREIVCIASLSYNKRHSLILEALSMIDGVSLTLVGDDGGAESSVRRDIARLNLADRVTFTGRLNDVREVLARADVVVLASRREGLPRALMEALCMGTPIAVTPTRGARDLAHAVNCPVARDDTAYSLAHAIREALVDTRAPTELRSQFLSAWAEGLEPNVTNQIVSVLQSMAKSSTKW